MLQALVADMRLNRSLDLASKQAMLNWADEEGRTALMWAAQKNHLHVAQLVGWASTHSQQQHCMRAGLWLMCLGVGHKPTCTQAHCESCMPGRVCADSAEA